jgi:hypothetical protein
MKSFIADLMVKRHHSVRFWKNGEKTFEDDFVEILSSGKIVDITDVAAEINTCWMDYKNRSETMKRTRGLMHSFCATLNEHKEVFNLIPSDNIYTSSLCAALKLLVNVCIVAIFSGLQMVDNGGVGINLIRGYGRRVCKSHGGNQL